MGIENNTHEIEVQNQELQRANREQIEQANKEHEELGKVLDGLDTLDNEAELDEISGNEDISEQDDAASQLDNNDEIEDETSEQFETINNPVYNEVENNGFSINDVNQAVDAKEAYEAEIRDMSQDEYHDQKELDQRVEENGSEPNMTEPSVLGNDLHQGDVSNKETDNRSRLNEPEQNAVDMERSTEETSGNDEIDDSLSDVSTVDETNVQEVKLSELPDNVQESYRKYKSDAENPEDNKSDIEKQEKAEDSESDTGNQVDKETTDADADNGNAIISSEGHDNDIDEVKLATEENKFNDSDKNNYLDDLNSSDGTNGPDNLKSPTDASDFRGSSLNVADKDGEPSWVNTSQVKKNIEDAGHGDKIGQIENALDKIRNGDDLSTKEAAELKDIAEDLKHDGLNDEANAIMNLRSSNAEALNKDGIYRGAEINNKPALERTEGILAQSDLSPSEVQDYLDSVYWRNPEIGDAFRNDRIIPEGRDIQIPREKEFLDDDGFIKWGEEAPDSGYIHDSDGNPVKEEYPENDTSNNRMFDRYGDEYGSFLAPMDKSGEPYSFESRSLPYVPDEANRHTYEETGNLANIVDDIKNSDLSDERKQELMDKLANGPYENGKYVNQEAADVVRNDPNLSEGDKTRKIEDMAREYGKTMYGEAAPAFKQEGGAIQVQTPLSVNELCEIGTLERR